MIEEARVLLAEDDKDMRSLVSLALQAEGFAVVEVRSGRALLEQIGSEMLRTTMTPGFRLIVSDIRMPGINGVDILAALRRSYWTIPVVLMTAFGDDELRARALRLGALAVLEKPFCMGTLRALARDAVLPRYAR